MKVEVKTVVSEEEESAVIQTVSITKEIQSAVDILSNKSRSIPAVKNGETVMCSLDKIYYIESVDKKTFVYTKEDCLEVKSRLYELEDTLDFNFLRCSKAMIINIRKIKSVKTELNGRMEAELLNGERIMISRSYVKELKRKLGLG